MSGTITTQRWGRPIVRERVAVVAVIALLLVASARSQATSPARWHVDPVDSDIHFELSAIGIVPIRGSFETFAGDIWRDPDDGLWRVDMRIVASSLAMASDRYRDWARSKEFFDVNRHPTIEFRSAPVPEALLVDGGDLIGTLRLRGVERTVAFHVQSSRCDAESDRCELHVLGDINRRQFGMISRRLTLSDRVTLDMRFVAVPSPSAAAPKADDADERSSPVRDDGT